MSNDVGFGGALITGGYVWGNTTEAFLFEHFLLLTLLMLIMMR